jgi:Protein of unknown function (DUF3305)
MAEDHFEVGVVAVRKKLKSPWADHAWLPHSVLPAVPAAKPWTSLGKSGDDELFYAGACELRLHPAETAHYRDNLTSGRPSLWVALRPIGGDEHEVAAVTADPYEGEALAGGIGEIIEAVPMPSEIQAKIGAFFDAHHVERVFFKRKRDRADPEALGKRGRARGFREDEE